MTTNDKPQFVHAVAYLATTLREPAPDAVLLRAYFRVLADLDIEFVVAAAEQLAAHATWFPKAAEWRVTAQRIAAERIEEQRAHLRRLPAPLCAVCDDTGWARGADGCVHRCPCTSERRRELLDGVLPSRHALPDATTSPESAPRDGRLGSRDA